MAAKVPDRLEEAIKAALLPELRVLQEGQRKHDLELQDLRRTMESELRVVHAELRRLEDKLSALDDKLTTTLDIRERLAALEARLSTRQ